MKKILFLLLLTIAGYGQTSTGQEQEFDYGIKNNSTQTITTPTYLTTTGTDGTQGKIPSAYIEKTADKISTITGYSETSYPNEKAVHDALDLKLNISDLPTNLTLYPTNVASDVGGYVKMVTDIHDADYNTVAVDVSTPTIIGTAQLVSQRISAPGVLIGQPGVFNITTFGNIKRLSGTGTANFYFEVYHRDLAGTETLICTSSVSDVVSLSTYSEFTASGIWDDGDFIATDRIVIKSYANRIAGGTDPVYQFQFGGTQPVRTLLPVPFSVVDAGYEMSANKQNSLAVDGTGTKYPTVDAVNAALPVTYSTVVYVNSTSPNTATIFDDVNPPVVNDPLLEDDTANLYIGNDASTWVYNGSTYVTKSIPPSSNFNIAGTTIDAGNDKTSNLERSGGAIFGGQLGTYFDVISRKGSSDTVLSGSNFRLFNNVGSEGNIFQLNASNGIDLWNYTSSTWNKRFTFSSDGYLTAANGQLIGGTGIEFSVPVFSTDGRTLINSRIYDSGINNINFNAGAYFAGNLIGSVFLDGGTNQQSIKVGNTTTSLWTNGLERMTINNDGSLTILTAPTTSSGTYDLLTRNTSTGVVEKVLSSTIATVSSPALTGTPTAPTAPPGTNTTQIATTAFVQAANGTFVADAITNGVTTVAPSQDAVFDALALKRDLTNIIFSGELEATSFKGGTLVLPSTGTGLSAPNNGAITFYNNHPSVPGWTANTNITATFYKTTVYTVATLPTTGVVSGTYATVSDATAPTYLGTLTGGGSVVCPVFYNGTAWVSH